MPKLLPSSITKPQVLTALALGVGVAGGLGLPTLTPLTLGVGSGAGLAAIVFLPTAWILPLSLFALTAAPLLPPFFHSALWVGAGVGVVSQVSAVDSKFLGPGAWGLGVALGWICPMPSLAIGLAFILLGIVVGYRWLRRRRLAIRVGRFEWVQYSSDGNQRPLKL